MQQTDTEDATLAVVVSKLDGVIAQISDLSTKMEDRPTWQDVRRIERGWEERLTAAVKQREIVTRNADHRITNVEAWQTWAGRLFIGGVVTALISAFFLTRS